MQIADLAISSADIAAGERIDDRFAGREGSQAPALSVAGVPDGAVELAVICHDPDAPFPQGFTHLTWYGLAPTDGPVEGGRPGPNGLGDPGYVGPFPPPGHGTHHYYFWVFALSRAVEGTPSREEFLAQYADAVIEQNRFVATYSN